MDGWEVKKNKKRWIFLGCKWVKEDEKENSWKDRQGWNKAVNADLQF